MFIKIGKHAISLWLAFVISGAFCLAAFAAYMTLTIPFTVKEPFEILDYPTTLNLYPGQTLNFTVTVRNNAPLSYAVFLDFSLDNATYRNGYVTANSEPYIVHPGTQSLAAWLAVSADAPSLNTALGLSFRREAVEDFATEQIQITNMEFLSSNIVRVTLGNTGIIPVNINEAWINNVKQTGTNPSLPVTVNADQGLVLNISHACVSGFTYQVKLITSRGSVFFYSATAP